MLKVSYTHTTRIFNKNIYFFIFHISSSLLYLIAVFVVIALSTIRKKSEAILKSFPLSTFYSLCEKIHDTPISTKFSFRIHTIRLRDKIEIFLGQNISMTNTHICPYGMTQAKHIA